jgi:PPM family protein phosphatase
LYSIHSASQSHPGLKRPRNEDFLAIYEPDDPSELQASGRLYIVTDGVGGAAQGDLASQYAAEKVLREYFRSSQLHPGSRLRQAMRQVGNEIYHYAAENLGPVHMATTMVVGAIWEDSLTIANVGDSRAYLIRNGAAQQLTRDHNLASELVRDGVITEEEAQNSPVKSRITRSLGGELDVFVDVFPDIPLRPGDRLLLCSDGLTRYARPDDVVRLAIEGSPEEAVQRMVDFANDAGGIDNTTLILIEIGEDTGHPDATLQPASGEEVQIQLPDAATADTLPGRALTAASLQETIRTLPAVYLDADMKLDSTPKTTSEYATSDSGSLADTLRTKPDVPAVSNLTGNAAPPEKDAPPAVPATTVPVRGYVPGRRLQPHRPFGRYTPSLILVLALVWLIGMLAVGGWFLFSRIRGDTSEAIATATITLPAVAPLASGLPPQPTGEITTEPGVGAAVLTPSASLPISPTLSAELTTTPPAVTGGRGFCQIAVQPGENLSIITTKLGIALQLEAFKCATGENGGCAYDPQTPDALRDGWVMLFPDVERSVCEQYNGTAIEVIP